jgi:hypothetical protein
MYVFIYHIELLIRAAEGLKKSIVLKTYVNDFKGGSAFDALITEADRCAQELRGEWPRLAYIYIYIYIYICI